MIWLAYGLVILVLVIAIITKNGITFITNKFVCLVRPEDVNKLTINTNLKLLFLLIFLIGALVTALIFLIYYY